MREEIINYLKGPRPWAAGVALYLKYGHNLMLRKTFMHRMETADLRVTLIEELRKLAGLSAAELSQLKRTASQWAEKTELPEQSPGPQDKTPTEAPPTVKKMIRFREKFKFLEAEDGYVILTKSSGDKSAVEVADSSREDGGNVQQLTRNGSLQQIWVLEPVEELIICGDLSGDGRVSVFDLIMLRQKLLDSQWEERCDVNSDSQFNMNDLVSLQSFLLGRSELDRPTRGTPRNTIFPRK